MYNFWIIFHPYGLIEWIGMAATAPPPTTTCEEERQIFYRDEI